MTDQNIEPVYFIGAVSHDPTPSLKTLAHRDGNRIAEHGNGNVLYTVFKVEGTAAEDIRILNIKLTTARTVLAEENAGRVEELERREKNPLYLRVLASMADLVYSEHERRRVECEDLIEGLLTDRDALATTDNARLAGYFTAKQLLYEVRQPLERKELPGNFNEGAAHYRISTARETALPEAVANPFGARKVT